VCKEDSRFARFFSGDTSALTEEGFKHSWATPYALAIYGRDFTDNCPFGNGNGYGDGRAISIGEVSLPTGHRWEFQLKGAGPTPFCRGADGRAVLRSSIREFLVSEAMFHLGVSTTRALSLTVSGTETVKRPWYNPQNVRSLPPDAERQLAAMPADYRQYLMAQIKAQLQQPNEMVTNPAAMTCRVSPSFIRVGHLQLFERRARQDSQRVGELQQIVEHTLFREFPHLDGASLQEKILQMLRECSERMSRLTAQWIRVGFCQGNFNSDNCLVAGRTMDYGPFGFIEKFEPLWNMWSGGGEHYGFLNQPAAGAKNFTSLCKAVQPLLDLSGQSQAAEIADQHEEKAQEALMRVWGEKLGLQTPLSSPSANSLIQNLLEIMSLLQADYTLFFRGLSYLSESLLESGSCSEEMIDSLADSFYKPLTPASREGLKRWLENWILCMQDQGKEQTTPKQIAQNMQSVNPKYVPREWMLVQAYSEAAKGDYTALLELQNIFLTPYAELSQETHLKFFRKAPLEIYEGVGLGGTAFMT
jgi:uncharacterized protein YdiU (UPF0061 family)